jgi:hypothetical protein
VQPVVPRSPFASTQTSKLVESSNRKIIYADILTAEVTTMGEPTRVRSPLLEGLLDLGQGAFASSGRPLSVVEESLLRDVFKQSVDYDPVRIAQTGLGAEGRPYTFGNTIRIPPKTDFVTRTLVHEMTHVWQYQTKGTGYLSDSIWHQATGSDAYRVVLAAGRSIHGYTAEQQAVIVESYYVDTQRSPKQEADTTEYNPEKELLPPLGWSLLPDVIRMLGEVQRARPISRDDRLKERLFGPGQNPPPSPGDRWQPNVLPLLRIEFD